MTPATLPVVVVVGRPNVGKSTLVNRILGRREAIVEARPGVTRDRKVVEAEWAGRNFSLVDTGGWLGKGESDLLSRQVSAQAERALADADVVLVVVDATVGITEDDGRVAELVHRAGTVGSGDGDAQRRPTVLLVANKVDDAAHEVDVWTFARLGLGVPWPVSALHGRGTGDLLDEVVAHLPELVEAESVEPEAKLNPESKSVEPPESTITTTPTDQLEVDADADMPAVAIVGRPNVGKSTIFNRLVGDERSVVHHLPGTTRDAIDTVVTTDHGPIRLVDTAGMRRKSRIDEGVEYYSLVRALQAVDRADVALLVIDAAEGVTHQDQRLAERIDAAGTAMVVVLNKWDLLDAEARAAVITEVGDRLAFCAYAPVLKVSGLKGRGVHRLVPAVAQALEAYRRRVPTRALNQLIQAAQASHPAPGARVLYAAQGATDPPTFTLFTDRALPSTYVRYLERRVREHFGFGPTPLKFRVRRRAS